MSPGDYKTESEFENKHYHQFENGLIRVAEYS